MKLILAAIVAGWLLPAWLIAASDAPSEGDVRLLLATSDSSTRPITTQRSKPGAGGIAFGPLKLTPVRQLERPREPEVWRPRGGGSNALALTVIAPADVGMTASDRPSLYFHISQPTTRTVIATLSRAGEPVPAKTWRLDGASAGFYKLELGPDVRLEAGQEYEWVVAVREDERHPSKDIVSMGFIRRVTDGAELIARRPASNEEADRLLQELVNANLFYDAIELALAAIEHRPETYRRELLAIMDFAEGGRRAGSSGE
jgi:hypothetical protein